MSQPGNSILKAKEHLRTALSENHNLSDHPKVEEAINALVEVWNKKGGVASSPLSEVTAVPARSNLFLGKWLSLSSSKYPNYIEKPGEPGTFQYTLGRLSFNIFQPKNLICTVNKVYNFVYDNTEEEHRDDEVLASYNNLLEITVHTDEGDLPAEICLDGRCSTKSDTSLAVVFTAGELKKGKGIDSNEDLLALWQKTFGGAYAKADKERGYMEFAVQWLVKSMLNMTMPSDDCARYEMKRPMKGYIDILYLDEDMRITKGNRGSIVIVERIAE